MYRWLDRWGVERWRDGETNRWVNDRWTDRQMEYRNIDQFIDAKERRWTNLKIHNADCRPKLA